MIWVLDFDRCSVIANDNAEELLARVLSKNYLTVPRARNNSEGYRSFKKGYVDGARRIGREQYERSQRILTLTEKTIWHKDNTSAPVGGSDSKTRVGQGRGMLRLKEADRSNWRAC